MTGGDETDGDETGGDETDSDETGSGRSWLALGLGVPAALLFAVAVAALVAVAAVLVPLGPLRSVAVGLAPMATDDRTAPVPSAFYLELAGVAGSLALSLALAAIYLRQNDVLRRQTAILDDQTAIQREQAAIQREQTRVAARQGHPLLTPHPDGVELGAGDPTLASVDDETAEIEFGGDGSPTVCAAVENHGDEVARRLEIVCLVDYEGDDPSPPDRVYPGVADVRVEGVATNPPSGEGGLLPPTDEPQLLVATPQFCDAPDHDGVARRFLGPVETHLERGDAQLRFGFALVFTNAVGSPFETVLEPGFAVDPSDYDPETDGVTVAWLRDNATRYDTADLVADLGWEIPTEKLEG